MYGPFLAIARKKRCSRQFFGLGGAAWSAAALAGETAPLRAARGASERRARRARSETTPRARRRRLARRREPARGNRSDVTFLLRWRTHSLQ
jgi:hypothetical protein